MADNVNHPAHYTRGPVFGYIGYNGKPARGIIEALDVIRHLTDIRLANAMKYIWRVGFGGKANDTEDIQKAIFYLNDWLDNPPRKPLHEEPV